MISKANFYSVNYSITKIGEICKKKQGKEGLTPEESVYYRGVTRKKWDDLILN